SRRRSRCGGASRVGAGCARAGWRAQRGGGARRAPREPWSPGGSCDPPDERSGREQEAEQEAEARGGPELGVEGCALAATHSLHRAEGERRREPRQEPPRIAARRERGAGAVGGREE